MPSPPNYQKLCREPWELFEQYYDSLGQMRFRFKSRMTPYLWMDVRTHFEPLQQNLIDPHFSATPKRSITWTRLSAAHIDSGLLVRDPRPIGPLQLQCNLRAAFDEPLIFGSITTFTEGSWYRVDANCDFDSIIAQRTFNHQFQTSATVQLGSVLQLGTQVRVDQCGRWAAQDWTLRLMHQRTGLSLQTSLTNIRSLYHTSYYLNDLEIPPAIKLGVYQRSKTGMRGVQLYFNHPNIITASNYSTGNFASKDTIELAFATSHSLNRHNQIKSKISSRGTLALAYVYRKTLQPGPFANKVITASVCASFDVKSFKSSLGFNLKFED